MPSRFIRISAAALIAVCIQPTSATVLTRRPLPAINPALHGLAKSSGFPRTFPAARRLGGVAKPAGCSADSGFYFLGLAHESDVAENYSGVVAGYKNKACDFSTAVGGGSSNIIGGDGTTNQSMIGAGYGNTIEGSVSAVSGPGYDTFIGGGYENAIGPGTPAYAAGAAFSAIGSGDQNTIGSPNSFIGGGDFNAIAPNAATNESVTNGGSSFIGGGSTNTISSNFAVISGGQNNTVGGDWATIGGGYQNQTFGGQYAAIGGGYENVASGTASVVGGGAKNSALGSYAAVTGGSNNTAYASYAFVGGGNANAADGEYSIVGGGTNNTASAQYAIVVGGNVNEATGVQGAIVGGDANVAGGEASAIGAGYQNSASGEYGAIPGGHANLASGFSSAISGGSNNTASGMHSAVAGGQYNIAAGTNSFAAGTSSDAATTGSFVWSDDAAGATTVKAAASNVFLARASGGFALYSSASLGSGVKLAPGSGSWSTLSDRAAKVDIADIDPASILAQVAELPVARWSYREQGTGVRHLGPMAQDFRAAFGLGEDDRHISTVDADGVALAALKALTATYADRQRQIADLRKIDRDDAAAITDLRARLARLEAEAPIAHSP